MNGSNKPLSNDSKKKSSKKENKAKKNDGDDEESKGFVEKQIMNENNQKIDILE
jgi:hypothetical protein